MEFIALRILGNLALRLERLGLILATKRDPTKVSELRLSDTKDFHQTELIA
jgi:hypothetical protein